MHDFDVRPLPEALLAFARDESVRLLVPGTAIGVLHDGVIHAGAVGITSIDDPLPVTIETLFQIGSTSKTFTATALTQLIAEGRVELGATVRTYLPDFRLQSEADAARLTVRDLVTHHAGFVGDYFKDTGRGDDAVAKIVAKMANSPQLVPAGTTFSYSNAAFYVLGHIVQTLRRAPFEQVIRERVFAPLGMTRSYYLPEDCIGQRTAMKHIVTADGVNVARPWHVPRSIAPGGGIVSTVVDQMRYAALHVGASDAPDVLGREWVEFMQRPQRAAGGVCDAIGVSWEIEEAGGGERLVKHGGSTTGHESSFEMIPARGFAVTVLTNADTGRESRKTIADACQRHFLGFDKPEPRLATGLSVHRADYIATYGATLGTFAVSVAGDVLVLAERPPARAAASRRLQPLPVPPARLGFTAPDRTVVLTGPHRGERVEFLRDAAGRIEWLRWDGRLARRQPDVGS